MVWIGALLGPWELTYPIPRAFSKMIFLFPRWPYEISGSDLHSPWFTMNRRFRIVLRCQKWSKDVGSTGVPEATWNRERVRFIPRNLQHLLNGPPKKTPWVSKKKSQLTEQGPLVQSYWWIYGRCFLLTNNLSSDWVGSRRNQIWQIKVVKSKRLRKWNLNEMATKKSHCFYSF